MYAILKTQLTTYQFFCITVVDNLVFLMYFVIMGENRFLPWTLLGLRTGWNDSSGYITDSFGQEWIRNYL